MLKIMDKAKNTFDNWSNKINERREMRVEKRLMYETSRELGRIVKLMKKMDKYIEKQKEKEVKSA